MTCPKCGHANPEGIRFCLQCGALVFPEPGAQPAPLPASTGMDYGQAFSFFFEDKAWLKKMLLGGLFNLLGVVIVGGIINAGYFIRVMRNVRNGAERVLPEWEDIGSLLSDGVAPWGIAVLYGLPSAVPSVAANLLLSFGNVVKQDLGTYFSTLSLCCSCLSFLGLLVTILAPAALVNYVRAGTFGAAFRFGEVFRIIRKHPGPYVLTILLTLVLHFLAAFGLIAFCIGVLATTFWASCASYHLYGQLCRVVGEEI